MSWGIYDVDLSPFVGDGSIFGKDRDAAFPFYIVGVHDTLGNFLVFAEYTALL